MRAYSIVRAVYSMCACSILYYTAYIVLTKISVYPNA